MRVCLPTYLPAYLPAYPHDRMYMLTATPRGYRNGNSGPHFAQNAARFATELSNEFFSGVSTAAVCFGVGVSAAAARFGVGASTVSSAGRFFGAMGPRLSAK